MQQNELANLLEISRAMVSRLAKRGMPTDTLERAQRWRKRHLEPGRVKGSRAGTAKPKEQTQPVTDTPPKTAPKVSVEDMEAVGDLIDGALNRGNQNASAFRIMQLRLMFRHSTDVIQDETIRLTVRSWVALLDHCLHEIAEIRHTPNMAAYLTAGECGECISPEGGAWAAHTVIWECCDFDDDALTPRPDGKGELDD